MGSVADAVLTGESTGDVFGASVSSTGDFDGDGLADVVVGAPHLASSTGRAYIFSFGPAKVSVADSPNVHRGLSVTSWPNPIRSSIALSFELDVATGVEVNVYDLSGRRVARPLSATILPRGRTSRLWTPR